jgi:UDPglucose--hexose-1-phosphate uridylyltransferase
MSELRYSLLARDWVIIASERAKRPSDFKKPKTEKPPLPKRKPGCPFCPGGEGDGRDEVYRLGDSGTWRTRVMVNKYPALSMVEEGPRSVDGLFKSMPGFGIHEVITEHPDHDKCMALMTDKEVEDVIRTYKARYDAIQAIEGIEAIVIFKNHGPRAGTSQEHPHSQIVATPVVPHNIRHQVEGAIEYHDVTGECLFCRMLEEELKDARRIVFESAQFVALVPYAGFAPFTTWIVPKRHSPSFGDIRDDEICALAPALRQTLGKLYYGLDDPDLNFVIRSAPVRERQGKAFHWSLGIIPRLTEPAGFELGSGMFINASIPEESAEFMRRVDIDRMGGKR